MMKEFIIREVEGDRSVVYGLDWAPLIGAKLDRQSLAHARRVKASHHVPAVEHSSSVGTINLPNEKKIGKARTLYSAGAIVALKHPTSAYLGVIQIEQKLVWVIATHNGSVIKGTDTLCSLAESETLVASVRKRYPQISDLEDTDVQSYLIDRTELKVVRYGVDALPVPLKVVSIVALAMLVGNLVWDQGSQLIQSYSRSHTQTPQVDAVQEWTHAMDSWAAETLVDGAKGYAAIFSSVADIPLKVGGWKLSGTGKNSAVQCDAPSQATWNCSAMYKRGPLATNESFLSARRQDWKIRWIDLDTALATWQVLGARHALSLSTLPKQSAFSIDYVSRLQNVSRAFTNIDVKASAPVAIPAPVVSDASADKVAVELPTSISLPREMTFTLKGPLRSLAAFPLNEHTRIKQLKFDVNLNETRPDVRSSALSGEINGEYYVQ